MRRRTLIAALSGGLLVGGCLDRSMSGGESTTSKNVAKIEAKLRKWEPSVECHEKRNSMYVSDIRVVRVRSSYGDDDVVVHFSDLSPGEKELLRTVTEDGGHGTCDISGAFDRFRDRMESHAEGLDRRRDEHVYLERNGLYYQLMIDITDQSFLY